MHENETLSVIIYFFNTFNETEAYHIWGGGPFSLGEHMINKYKNFVSTYGHYAAPALFICDLDAENYQKVVDRACELYNGRKNLKHV